MVINLSHTFLSGNVKSMESQYRVAVCEDPLKINYNLNHERKSSFKKIKKDQNYNKIYKMEKMYVAGWFRL